MNPKRGAFHFRAPGRILWRTIRGMIRHKTHRGAEALKRLKCFEGCPSPFDKTKKVVVPAALRVVRLAPGRKYCDLGRLSHEVGWKYKAVVAEQEDKRKEKAAAYYEEKKKAAVSVTCLFELHPVSLFIRYRSVDHCVPLHVDFNISRLTRSTEGSQRRPQQ